MDAQLDELLELEHAGWRSLCDGTGAEFYGRMMTDDAVMVLANGAVMTHADVVESLADAPPWKSYSIDDPTTVSMGRNVAALVYTGTGSRGEGQDFVGVMSSTYVHGGGEWKLALYQQTPKS